MFLTEQYNDVFFQRVHTDNVGGFTFRVILLLPKIEFLNDQARVQVGFSVDAFNNTYYGVLAFEDDLSFTIPTLSASGVSVAGISEGFVDEVNNLSTHQENIFFNLLI